jgi:tetratricopeptide (TPR) repeat protein
MDRSAKNIRVPDEPSGGCQEKPRSGNRSTVAAVGGLLLLAVIAVFGQTAGHDFVNFDDDLYVFRNRHVLGGLTDAGIAWAFTETRLSAHWHPLTWLSLMADAQVLAPGEGPQDRARLAAGMHLVNLALHAANAVLLFLVLRAMTASTWPSALVAAVFAVHPLHVESVAWITERKDVLSGLFGLLALGAYVWYARGPSVARYLVVAIALALGLMAKPVLVTWPLVFLLLDYWPLGRFSQRFAPRTLQVLVVEKIPLLLLAGTSAVVAFLAQRSGGTVISLQSVPIWERTARAAVLYVVYLGKTFWPVNLAAIYPEGAMESYWPALGAGLLLAALTAGALWGAWRGQPWLAVGWLWYLGTLLPTIGLVQLGLQVRADRFLYLPQIGLCVALVWGARWEVQRLCGHWPSGRLLRGVGGAVLVAGLTVRAWQQTSYWRDSETLWTHTLACTARNPFAHDFLGTVLGGRGEMDKAITHFQKALEFKPDDAEAHYNLGAVLAGRGQVDEAFSHFQKALEIEPDFLAAHNNFGIALAGRGRIDEAIGHYRKALEIEPDFAETHYNLGVALARRGQVDEAIAHYRRALELDPAYVEAHYNLGVVLAGRGQADEAIAHYQTALKLQPDCAEAHYNLGVALAHHGLVSEALAHYRRALEIKPNYAEAHNNFGAALAGRGEVDEAIAHFRKSLEIRPDNAEAHYNLARLLSGRGSVDEAQEHYRQALGLAIAQNQRALAETIRARIRLPQQKINKK